MKQVRQGKTNTIWYQVYVESKKEKEMYLAKQKQTHRHRKQTFGCQGGAGKGEGWTGNLGLVDANYYI